MSALDNYFRINETVVLGSHVFEAEAIKEFAQKFDPQPFHIDEKAAEKSLFGGLCASGWHTAATWMKYNLLYREDRAARPWSGQEPEPQFGPSPGFKNLRWLKPVYAGETITFTRRALAHRTLASRPGWRVLTMLGEAFNSSGDKVLEFESAVLVQAE